MADKTVASARSTVIARCQHVVVLHQSGLLHCGHGHYQVMRRAHQRGVRIRSEPSDLRHCARTTWFAPRAVVACGGEWTHDTMAAILPWYLCLLGASSDISMAGFERRKDLDAEGRRRFWRKRRDLLIVT